MNVSIVVPVYNGEHLIAACIEHLLRQTYTDGTLEIIVVDNNSQDATVTVASRYPVTILYERERQSSYAARNRGIAHATGAIVAFTDADCRPKPDWIAELVKSFHDPSVVGVGGEIIDAPPTNAAERFSSELQPLKNGIRLSDSYLISFVTANAAYRRATLEKVGGFDEAMITGGDIDLSWRVQRQQGGKLLFAPNAKVLHRHRSTWRGVYRQFKRYGYCSLMMTARHRTDATYPQSPRWQLRKIARQCFALAIYVLSFVNRIVRKRKLSTYDKRKPLYQFVAEAGTVSGRLHGLMKTRFFHHSSEAERRIGL